MLKSSNQQNTSNKNVTITKIDQIEENSLISSRLVAIREMIRLHNQQNNDFSLSKQADIKLTGQQIMTARQNALSSLSQPQKLKC